ncbi:hypothetical protein M153_7010002793 [Pseudoloma neurophilia]|uniref:Uncharacterized protein n=1 Tax=Pseudoloma neurophilia TaxID=146866 RepID=A0A0R0LWA2_9MICR|nr:hypothetical protein M153_7010002793 [Pseudoloma neurophilia]
MNEKSSVFFEQSKKNSSQSMEEELFLTFRLFKLSIHSKSKYLKQMNTSDCNDIYNIDDCYKHFFRVYLIIADDFVQFIQRKEVNALDPENKFEFIEKLNQRLGNSHEEKIQIESSEKDRLLFVIPDIFAPTFSISRVCRLLTIDDLNLKMKFYTEQESKLCFDHLNTQFVKINQRNTLRMNRQYKEIKNKFKRLNGGTEKTWNQLKGELNKQVRKKI